MIEVALMVFLLTLTLVPISNALNLAHGIEETSLGASMIYGISAASNPAPIPVKEIRETIRDTFQVTPRIFSSQDVSYTLPDGAYGYMILISPDMFSHAVWELEQGEFTDQPDEYIPVLISPLLAQTYQVGDIIPCQLKHKTVFCRVTGVLKENSTLLSIHEQQGDIHTLGAIGFNMAKYKDDGIFIVAVSNDQIGISEADIRGAVFAFEKGTDTDVIVEKLNETYSYNYAFYSAESLKECTIEKSIKDMDWRIVLLFLFVIVVVFNFVAYIVINTRQKQKILSVMNICGLSFGKTVLINGISLMLVVLPALVIGMTVSPYLLAHIEMEYYGFNGFLGAGIIVIFAGTVLAAVVTSMWQRKHIDTINVYKKG